jgi:surface protein
MGISVCACADCKCSLPSFLATVFYNATNFTSDLSTWDVSRVAGMAYMFMNTPAFNSDVSAWDVRTTAEMTDMFSGSGVNLQSLCGYHWMQNAVAQLAFNTELPQIGIDKNGTICHCPVGTCYKSRIKPTGELNQSPPPRLESCVPCPAGTFSLGGNKSICQPCDILPWGEYCVEGRRTACPNSPADACVGGSMESSSRLLKGIPPEALEYRESELSTSSIFHSTVQPNLFEYRYEISLAFKPIAPVTVIVEATRNRQSISCISHIDRFKLVTEKLNFSAENYSKPQVVYSLIKRDKVYQGSLGLNFRHIVATQGFSRSALSASLTILDDDSCDEGASLIEAQLGNDNNSTRSSLVRICQCQNGYFVETVDANFCESATSCSECPSGMVCSSASSSSGQVLAEAKILPKWYRFHANSTKVVKCPKPATQCIGEATHGDALCAEGYNGPFCMICELGNIDRFVRSDDKCIKCSDGSIVQLYLAATLIVLFCIGVLLFLKRCKKRSSEPERLSAVNTTQSKYKVEKNH